MANSIRSDEVRPYLMSLGPHEKFGIESRSQVTTTGKELWNIKVSDTPVSPQIVCENDGRLLIQTANELIAISPESHRIIWKKKVQDSNFLMQVDDFLIHTQNGNKHLTLREGKTAEEKKIINISMNPYNYPAITSNKFLIIEEQRNNQNLLRAYDFELNFKWDFILPQQVTKFQFFVFKNSIVLATEHSLEGISLEGKSEWKIGEEKLGSIPCSMVSKLSDHQLLVYFFEAKGTCLIIDINNLTIQPIILPCRILGTPLVTHNKNGDFQLIYKTNPIKVGDHENRINRIVKVDSHGTVLSEIRDDQEPRNFITDRRGHLFVTYSPSLENYKKYYTVGNSSTCYVRCFDEHCQELYRFTTDYPITSSLDIGADGVIYLFCKDTLHAIG